MACRRMPRRLRDREVGRRFRCGSRCRGIFRADVHRALDRHRGGRATFGRPSAAHPVRIRDRRWPAVRGSDSVARVDRRGARLDGSSRPPAPARTLPYPSDGRLGRLRCARSRDALDARRRGEPDGVGRAGHLARPERRSRPGRRGVPARGTRLDVPRPRERDRPRRPGGGAAVERCAPALRRPDPCDRHRRGRAGPVVRRRQAGVQGRGEASSVRAHRRRRVPRRRHVDRVDGREAIDRAGRRAVVAASGAAAPRGSA